MTDSIDRIFAYIAVGDEGEGIIGKQLPNGNWIPLIGADEAAVKGHHEYAQALADRTGKRIVLAQFDVRKDLLIIEPTGETQDLPEYDIANGPDTRDG